MFSLIAAQGKNYEADGMTNDLELMDERNPVSISVCCLPLMCASDTENCNKIEEIR